MVEISFLSGIRLLLKNRGLRYPFIATLIFIAFYYVVLIMFKMPTTIPEYAGEINIYVVSFLLVMTFSVYLLLLTVLMLIPSVRSKLLEGSFTDIKLLIINAISFGFAMFLPPIVFMAIYFVPFIAWTICASLFMVVFLWDISDRITLFAMKFGKKMNLILFVLFFIMGFVTFGAFYMNFDFSALPFESSMILLVFPLYIILLPIVAMIMMYKRKTLKQVSFFGLLVFAVEGYYFIRFNHILVVLGGVTDTIDTIDAVIQMFLVVYGLGTMAYNGERLSRMLKLSLEVILLPLLWFKVSSMIVLMTVSEVTVMGYSAVAGSYLALMFGIMIIGTIYGLYNLIKSD